jgi:CRISPR-associated protein Cas5d
MIQQSPLEVKVWGRFACFTRPEMKVERMTYPVMTPSAARGVLEAIFWKPEVSWQIEEIWVLKPIRYYSILRNEVNSIASARSARDWERNGGGFFADEDRAQRHTLALREVAYLIRAQIVARPPATDDIVKYRDQFRRRVRGGQCFARPYLGCREFAANFAEPDGSEQPLGEIDGALGPMLFDLTYAQDGAGAAQPRFFPATIERGVLRVPTELYAGGG